jgi:hypothetical protein
VALTRRCGVSLLTAGAPAGILGPGRRFATDARLAAYTGGAPLEASSAGRGRHRLNRGGHRRLNAILYRIAVTQAGASPQAKASRARRAAEGETRGAIGAGGPGSGPAGPRTACRTQSGTTSPTCRILCSATSATTPER